MNEYFELGLESYNVFPDGMITISFSAVLASILGYLVNNQKEVKE